MKSVLDELPDESPISTGEEIGQAVALAIEAQGARHEALIAVLAEALSKIQPADTQVTVQPTEVKQWVFNVVRNKNGLIDKITATAK